MQTNNNNLTETENLWQDFITNGSVYSYLRYRGINICDTDTRQDYNSAAPHLKDRDGEPIGYC